MFNSTLGRAVVRFLRVVGGAALAASIVAGISYFQTMPEGTPEVVTVIGAALLVAIDKFLRGQGVY